MIQDLIDFFQLKIDELFDGLITIADFLLNALLNIVLLPLDILLAFAPTELINEIILSIESPDNGLYKLFDVVTFLDHVVDINSVLGVLSIGFTVTAGVLVYKMIIKLIPFVG